MSWLNVLQPFSFQKTQIRELAGIHSLQTLHPCLLPVKNTILQVGREADEFALVFSPDVGMGHSQGMSLDFKHFWVH